ncbi:MAG: vitamin K epoxide reductase family protein [Phycisphaerae bacterium]
MTSPDKQPADISRPGAELFAPLLCLIGLCIAAYLSAIHYALILGDLSLGGACGGGTWGDCNSVVASRYGKLLGLPVSIWGIWYYITAGTISVAILMLRREDTPAFVRALLWLTAAALLFDAYLGWTMWRHLERLCPLCAATYAVNVAILIIALRCRRKLAKLNREYLLGPSATRIRSLLPRMGILLQPRDPVYYREVLKTFLIGASTASCVLVLVLAVIVSHAVSKSEKDKLASLIDYLHRIDPFVVSLDREPLDRESLLGPPSRGPDNAPITIVVFSDFLCEQCKLASEYLDIVAANHRDSLRMVYMHYPVDAECNEYAKADMHPGACTLARAGECAHRQGRFWQFHDVVFDDPGRVKPEKVTEYAALSGLDLDKFNACLTESTYNPTPERKRGVIEAVRADITTAHSVGVTATPTSYINGRPVVGALKPWMLEAAIEAIAPLPLPTQPQTGGQ